MSLLHLLVIGQSLLGDWVGGLSPLDPSLLAFFLSPSSLDHSSLASP